MAAKDSNPVINRPLKNINCAYYGVELDVKSSTKEHVIGKQFVPKGKLDGQWNLILNEALTYLTMKKLICIFPMFMGWIADVSSMSIGFLAPIPLFAFILYYSVEGHKVIRS